MHKNMPALRNTLSTCALAFALLSAGSNAAYAQCATSGAIATTCSLTADTTGALTVGAVANTVTINIQSNVTLGHTINDDDTTPDAIINTGASSLTITQNADIGNTDAINSITINNSDTWIANANITATSLNINNGGTFNLIGNAVLDTNLSGSSGNNTITSASTGDFGSAGNIFTLGAGDDTISVTSALTINADSIDGGDGDDIILINGNDITINSILNNVEDIEVQSANQLTITNEVNSSAITLDADGSSLVVNAAGDNINGSITGTDGGDIAQTVTLTDGSLSAGMSLNDGDDIVNLNGGSYSGNISTGTGDDTLNVAITTIGNYNGGGGTDTLNATGTANISGTVQGIETINIGANSLTISNSITGIGTANDTGIDVGSGTLNINDGGSVTGAIHATSTGTLAYGTDASGGTFTLNGIVEDVALTITSGTLSTSTHIMGANSALDDITIASNGTLNARTNVTSGGDLSNTGNIRIGTTTTITAATQTDAAGSYTFEFDRDLNHGSILINAADADVTNASFTVDADNAAPFSLDQTFLIVDGTTTINNGASQALTQVTDNSFFWDFSIADGVTAGVTGGNDSDLYLVISTENTVEDLGINQNNIDSANTIRSFISSSDTELSAAIDSLNSVQSGDELNEKAEALQPSSDGAHAAGSQIVSNKTFNLVKTRLASVKSARSGVSSGDNYERPAHLWGKTFGTYAKQDERDNIAGYSSHSYGVAVGADAEITDGLTVGIAGTYATSAIESDNSNETKTDINTYQASLYADYDITKRAYLTSMVAYSSNRNNTERTNVAGVNGLNAKGDFSSLQASTNAELGYKFYTNNGIQITPSINASYVHYDSDPYKETGAGGAGLNIESDALNSLEFGGAVEISAIFKKPGSREMVKPSLRLGYRHDVIGDQLETTSSFIGNSGTSFNTKGFDPAVGTYEIGFGLEYFRLNKWSLNVEYGAEKKEDYLSHQASLQARYPL